MLPRRTAKPVERVTGNVMSFFDRDFLDRIRHVFHSNQQKTFGNLFGRVVLATGRSHLTG